MSVSLIHSTLFVLFFLKALNRMLCKLDVGCFSGVNFKDPELVYSRSLEMIKQQTCKGVKFFMLDG